MQKITAKIGDMRKAVEWVVYPAQADDKGFITIQSEKRIARFDRADGKGLLSKSCPNGAYFLHLNPIMGATAVLVPSAVVAAAVNAQPKSGDKIGPGVYVA